ncbi:MAG TPA: ABC-2 family transporter protein [Anaerolineales bacterium]|nr:ABC-2 family transporter protein [Anaerolineales bacterium]
MRFLLALWKANLLSAMEYRVSFILQVLGMMLNNAAYFVFWFIFFERFESVRGWGLVDMFVLFGIVAASFGLGVFLFGNIRFLADMIAEGRMDYYLSLPRPVLLHSLASRSTISGLGDFIYGLISFALAGQYSPDAVLRFALGVVVGTTVLVAFLTIAQSLAFWIGSASMIAMQASNAIVTFSLYPLTLFDGTAKLILFTILPAAFIGSVPAEFVRAFSWEQLAQMSLAAVGLLALAIWVFQRGLRRYESGSAIQVQV